MSPARRFPFGKEPALMLAQPTTPLAPLLPPPDPQATVPLIDFMPPGHALPFREPPPAAPGVALAARVSPLVPPPPPRAPRRSRVSFRTAASLVLLALDLLVIGYLLATWRPG